MAGCCDPSRYEVVFDERFARRRAGRYRARGLDRATRALVDLLDQDGVPGATVLEVGGGVGEVQLELLRRGAASATGLELSAGYDSEAAALISEAGVVGRVRRRRVDIAADPAAVEPADLVVLHRVVCCCPDVAPLLAAAADHARHQLVFSHPSGNLLAGALGSAENVVLRLSGREFRTSAHPPATMLAVLAEHGLRPRAVHQGPLWTSVALAR